ncbi:MAG: c-type cytochrome [Bdellovibrionales bacterium]|nr:c-type cytochrome [Bdellovibrionales bacterium]
MARSKRRLSALFVAAAGLAVGLYPYLIESYASVERHQPELLSDFKRPLRIPFPAQNPYTQEKYELGKKLFFDPLLSGSRMVSCSSCHNPGLNWTDGLGKGVGHAHQELDRKVPTLLNVAWGWNFFWDGRAEDLEAQALGPIQSHREMNLSLPELVSRLKENPGYRALFASAFPRELLSAQLVGKALATFERTIVSGLAPFDKWVEGDADSISAAAKRGFILFTTKARCITCHSGWRFSNESFADIGLKSKDLGRGGVVVDEDLRFTFKVPTLRNIALRAPYMHDGSLRTLDDVLRHYNQGGAVKRPTSVRFVQPLHLNKDEQQDLVAFLKTLTSEEREMSLPRLPR